MFKKSTVTTKHLKANLLYILELIQAGLLLQLNLLIVIPSAQKGTEEIYRHKF